MGARPNLRITLRQVSYFLATAKLASVTAAATTLGVSQSAVTDAIRLLEGDLSTTLFARNARGMELTLEGHHFLRHAKMIQAAVADAERSVAARSDNVSGRLNLGVTSLVSGYFPSDLAVS